MKLPKHLYSRLALVTCFILVVGYFVVYATYQTILPAEYAVWQSLSSAFMGKVVGNIADLNTRLSNLNFSSGSIVIGIPSLSGKLNILGDVDAWPNSAWDGASFVIWDVWWYHIETDSNEIHAMSGNLTSTLHLNADGWIVSFFGNIGTWSVGIWTAVPSYTLHVNGSVAGISWTSLSDRRLKTNIETLTGVLDKIDKLRGVYFDWNNLSNPERNFPTGKQVGFIAQEVESVYPELVTQDKEGIKGVEYANMTAVLVEAIKELKKENSDLKALICMDHPTATICK